VLGSAALLLLIASCERCGEQAQQPAAPSRSTVASHPALPRATGANSREAPRLAPVPDTPLTGEDTASCDDTESLHKRIACIGSLAQRNRDPRFCDKIAELSKQATDKDPDIIRSGTAANACLRTIAFMRDDPSICTRIVRPAMAGSCLSYFAMKRQDPKLPTPAT